MTTSGGWTTQVIEHMRRLEEYRETISRLFPALPRDLLDARSIRDVDAMVLALFLRCYPHELHVLEVGTLFGVATFHFAGQPSVVKVVGVDPRAAEDADGLSSIDVARAALAEFADENVKIQLQTSDVGSIWTESAHEIPEGGSLLAFLGGARTREAV